MNSSLKSLCRVGLVLSGVLFGQIISLRTHAQAPVVGALPGDVSVDNKGAANYTIPLAIPPGRSGMQPKLTLAYSSQGSNGHLGRGWSLSTGFPQSITRGRTILARDGSVAGVKYTANDRLYLDGKRLIVVSGQNGMPGSVYRTELETFGSITAEGSGAEIDRFVMIQKDGTKLIFGGVGSDARHFAGGETQNKVHAWAIKSVEDAVGNSVEFVYDDLDFNGSVDATQLGAGEHLLTALRYTGNSIYNISASWEIRFLFDTDSIDSREGSVVARADQQIRFTEGRSVSVTKHLDRIAIYDLTASSLIQQYRIKYSYGLLETNHQTAETGLVLTEVYLADAQGARLTESTEFEYGRESMRIGEKFIPSFSVSPAAALPGTASEFQKIMQGATADYNRDGVADFVIWRNKNGHNGSSALTVYLSQPDKSYLGAINLYTGQGDHARSVAEAWACDFNGDGYTDIVYFRYNSEWGGVHDGGYFVSLCQPGVGFAPPVLLIPERLGVRYRYYRQGASFVRDMNGDGLPDIVTATTDFWWSNFLKWQNQGGAMSYWFLADTAYGNGGNFSEAFQELLSGGDDPPPPQYEPAGQDGCEVYRNTTSVGSGVPQVQLQQTAIDWSLGGGVDGDISDANFETSDFNGDGLPDIKVGSGGAIMWYPESLGPSEISIYSGHGFALNQGGWSFSAGPSVEGEDYNCKRAGAMPEKRILTGDFNGDGSTDLLRIGRRRDWDAPHLVGEENYNAWNALTAGGATYGWVTDNWTGVRMGLSDGTGRFNWDNFGGLPDSVNTPEGLRPIGSFEWGSWYTHPEQPGRFLEFNPGKIDGVAARDLDGDGADDLLFVSRTADLTAPLRGVYGVLSRAGVLDPQRVIKIADLSDIYNQEVPFADGPPGSWMDMNGDGLDDWVAMGERVWPSVAYRVFAPGNRLIRVKNGLGAVTIIQYKSGYSPEVYTPGVPTAYPIADLWSGALVVSDVYKDAGRTVGESARYSYQYSGNRLDLSGRGPLGFHSFVTLDRQTSLFKYQFLAQSFPMTGLTAREMTCRYWVQDGHAKIRYLQSQDNTVVFDEVVKSPQDQTAWGTVFAFISKAVQSRWENADTPHLSVPVSTGGASSKPNLVFSQQRPAGSHIEITVKTRFDEQTECQVTLPSGYHASDRSADWNLAGDNVVKGLANYATFHALAFPRKITFGNVVEVFTDNGGGYTETAASRFFSPSEVGGRVGLVRDVTSTVTAPGLGPEQAPVKEYTYAIIGGVQTGLVATEKSNAPGVELDLTTHYLRAHPTRPWLVTATKVSGHSSNGSSAVVGSLSDEHALHIGEFKTSTFNAFDPKFDLPSSTDNAEPYLHTTSTTYHSYFGLPISETDEENGAETATTYDALGRAVEVWDKKKGLRTNTEYGWTPNAGSGWLGTRQVDAPDGVGGVTVESVYAVRVKETAKPATITYYDRLGRAIRVEKEGFGTLRSITDNVFNSLGQSVAVSLPYAAGATAADVKWTKTSYDVLGRPATVLSPTGTVTTNEYFGRLTRVRVDAPDREAQTNTTLVDAKGKTVKVWNSNNSPELIPYGSSDAAKTSNTTPSIEFQLDGFGRMRRTLMFGLRENENHHIRASYDAYGRQTQLVDPDKGTWSFTNNALGQVVRQVDARGTVTRGVFDRLGRQISRTTSEADNGPIEYSDWYFWDSGTNGLLHTVAKNTQAPADSIYLGWTGAPQREESRVVGASGYNFPKALPSDPDTISVHYYESRGLSTIDLNTIDGKWFYKISSYDEFCRLSGVRGFWRPAGAESPATQPYAWLSWGYNYLYDGDSSSTKSFLTTINDTAGRTWWAAPTYDHMDRVVSVRKGNGHFTQKTFDPEDGLVTAIRTGPSVGSGLIQTLNFSYDGLGNLVGRSVGALEETYGYDDLNRLATRNGSTYATYSGVGNLASKIDVDGAQSPTYVYDQDKPRAVVSAFGFSMTYDANGNMLTRTKSGRTWSTRWAGFDKPRWLAENGVGSEFHYSAGRERTIHLKFDSMSGGVPSHYRSKKIYALGSSMEVDYLNTAAGGASSWKLNRVRLYVPGPGDTIGTMEFAPFASFDRAEQALVYHYDHLGSIECITPYGDNSSNLSLDEDGRPCRYSYDAWGQRRNPTTWIGSPLATAVGGVSDLASRGYTGHEMLDDLGLVHMNGRIYDPLLGRFMSADTYVQAPDMEVSYDRYAYVRNNPLTFNDPSGHFWSALVTVAFAAVDTYQYATGKISGAEYAANMALNGAALIADVATLGQGGGLAVRAANVAIRAAKAIDKANDVYETAKGVVEAVQAGAELAGKLADGSATLADGLNATLAVGGALLDAKGGGKGKHADDLKRHDIDTKRADAVPKEAPGTHQRKPDEAASAGGGPDTNGPLCNKCFVVGTRVLTPEGFVSIETITVGDRVETETSLAGIELPSVISDPAQWRKVTILAPNRSVPESPAEVVTLLPASVVEERGWKVGLFLDVTKFGWGYSGEAIVTAIEPCPAISEGRGRVVLSTFRHLNGAPKTRLTLRGLSDPVSVTGEHPFYVHLRGWTKAERILEGDLLITANGDSREVERKEQLDGVTEVFNFEVDVDHQYFVTDASLLCHNCKTQLHHSDPKFMGGAEKQKLTEMPTELHQQLHKDLNDHLSKQTDEFGNHMRPQRGNSGERIRENFTDDQRRAAMADFYRANESKYPEAAKDFFDQHPSWK